MDKCGIIIESCAYFLLFFISRFPSMGYNSGNSPEKQKFSSEKSGENHIIRLKFKFHPFDLIILKPVRAQQKHIKFPPLTPFHAFHVFHALQIPQTFILYILIYIRLESKFKYNIKI